ncbi:hypothetical protein LY76DRAFT_51975 [Colletotrichum caudatum]|nr:hypothetical protein LY76DRAFT_51975 [Colletotrichum caudatum]
MPLCSEPAGAIAGCSRISTLSLSLLSGAIAWVFCWILRPLRSPVKLAGQTAVSGAILSTIPPPPPPPPPLLYILYDKYRHITEQSVSMIRRYGYAISTI